MSRVRVGVVGTGVIAQVMHLHYLAELADRFDVEAVCDLDGEGARACAERYGIPAVSTITASSGCAISSRQSV